MMIARKELVLSTNHSLMVFAAANAGLGLLHIFFSFANPAFSGLSSEGFLFMILALLFFAAATGFMFRNRLIVLLASIPVVLISGTFSFLIVGGAWIWGHSRADQMYLFIAVSVIIAVLEIVGILSILRYSKRERAEATPADT
jgi:NADH:ubiquinone oxidoreductase subunit K